MLGERKAAESDAAIGGSQRVQAAWACHAAPGLEPTTSHRWHGTGRPGGLRAHGAPCAASPSQLCPFDSVDLRSLSGNPTARAFVLLAKGGLWVSSQTPVQSPTSELRWSLDARPDGAAQRSILPSLQQSRNPAPRAINPQPQLLSNPSAESSSRRSELAGNLQSLPRELQANFGESGDVCAWLISL